VGVALLPLSFWILHNYREKVNNLVNEEFSRLLGTKEITKFAKMVQQKKVTFTMVSDFYKQFEDAYEPKPMLRRSWIYLLTSGILFIVSSIFGSINIALVPDIIGFELMALGLFLMIVSILVVMELENRLSKG
jgi:hypothetical protein